MAQKLRLKVSQIKDLQKKHGIANLLQPEGGKLADVNVLTDIYYEGSRSWTEPPSLEAIDDLTVGDLIDAWKQSFAAEAEGNV